MICFEYKVEVRYFGFINWESLFFLMLHSCSVKSALMISKINDLSRRALKNCLDSFHFNLLLPYFLSEINIMVIAG